MIPGFGRSPGGGIATPVFLPGEFPGPRSLVGYTPWGCKESDMAERLTQPRVKPGGTMAQHRNTLMPLWGSSEMGWL